MWRPLKRSEALAAYVMKTPTQQNAVDLFEGEWSSALPEPGLTAGSAPLFRDRRIELFAGQVGGFKDKSILELGPLEGSHSYMMDRAGAASILAIEANARAYLKCLICKEIVGIPSARFLLGDFDAYLEETEARFDFALASGVIYHCVNPVRTLSNLTRVADRIGIWSHYFEEARVRPLYGRRFAYRPRTVSYGGIGARTYRHTYRSALRPGFCGGGNSYTRWMPLEEWEKVLSALGFELRILEKQETHQNGPSFTAVAARRGLEA